MKVFLRESLYGIRFMKASKKRLQQGYEAGLS